MNGMLQHHEIYSHHIERHQQEAHGWAHDGALGRLAQGPRAQSRFRPRRIRLLAVASPMAVALGMLVILI